jgi:hypothetical protein
LMLLWYWATVERLVFARLLPSAIGGLVGIGLAWGMFYGWSTYGAVGLAVGLFTLVIAIYLDIIRALPMVVNPATMLYSIVAAAPLVQLRVNWLQLCLATIGGALYFGAFVAAVTWLGRAKSS